MYVTTLFSVKIYVVMILFHYPITQKDYNSEPIPPVPPLGVLFKFNKHPVFSKTKDLHENFLSKYSVGRWNWLP